MLPFASCGPKRQRGEAIERFSCSSAMLAALGKHASPFLATFATPFTRFARSGSCHPERFLEMPVFCRACSWHAFLYTQIDPGNRNQRVAQTSLDVCVPQAQD